MDVRAVSAPENPERSLEYRQRASECRTLAYEVCNDGSREELLALADVWMTLAEAPRANTQ